MHVKKLKIGNIEIENNILLAPMAGITDLSFRRMCKKYGQPGLVYTEMASSKAIFYGDIKTQKLLNVEGEKKPVAIQIFGSNPEVMKQVAKQIEPYADIIDINMGCPAPKVVKNGDGSKLLLNLELIEKIVYEVKSCVNVPITVKIRTGWNEDNKIAVEVAQIIEKAGASAITIHGRTREQYYSGQVDIEMIKKVKQSVKIPVIGNGDIKTAEDAKKMFEITGVDGIMIGRANLGVPWKTKEIINNLQGQNFKEPSNIEKFQILKEHIEMMVKEKGEYIAVREMRKHICWYIKKLPNSSIIRDKVNKLESKEEVEACLEEYFKCI